MICRLWSRRFACCCWTVFFLCSACSYASDTPIAYSPKARHYDAVAIEKKSFDRANFVQGLEFQENTLLVSSGLYGQSALRAYSWPELELVKEQPLPAQLFGEGLTRIDEKIYLLTWRARRLLVIDAETLQIEGVAQLPGEGWGATSYQNQLFWSDGSDRIMSIELGGDSKITVVHVTLDGAPVYRLNELEWIDGEIWANVWQTNEIMRIEPNTGRVTGVIHLPELLNKEDRQVDTDVLNGIALHQDTGDVWVTGKRWPWLYKITLESR